LENKNKINYIEYTEV